MFGDAINLAARLMVQASLASSRAAAVAAGGAGRGSASSSPRGSGSSQQQRQRPGLVFCDTATQALVRGRAHFTLLEPMAIKGKQAPVDVYEVKLLRPAAAAGRLSPSGALPHSLLPPGITGSRPDPALAAAAAGTATATARLPNGPPLPPLPRQQQPTGNFGGSSADNSSCPRDSLASKLHPASTGLGATARPTVPMVGREAELGALCARVTALVEQGTGGVVLVEGEPGMGKSRLVQELAGREMGGAYDHCCVFSGAGRSDRRSQALYPWRRVLRDLFHHDAQLGQLACPRQPLEAGDRQAVVTQLGQRLRAAAPEYASWRAALADAFDLPLAWFPAAAPPESLEEAQAATPRSAAGRHGRTPRASEAQASCPASAALPGIREEGGAPPEASSGDSTLAGEGIHQLREDDKAFLSAEDRARSFAIRMKRSVSHSLASPSAAARQAAPRASAAAARPQSPDTPDSASTAPSCATAASFFSHTSSAVLGSPAVAASLDAVPAPKTAEQQAAWSLMREATALRGALALAPLARPVEVSVQLRAKKVQELVAALMRCFVGKGVGAPLAAACCLGPRHRTCPQPDHLNHVPPMPGLSPLPPPSLPNSDAYGPLVLILEDLHYWDTASWRLLCFLADELHDRVLLVATYRPRFGRLAMPSPPRGAS